MRWSMHGWMINAWTDKSFLWGWSGSYSALLEPGQTLLEAEDFDHLLFCCGCLIHDSFEKEDWKVCVGYFCPELPQLGRFSKRPLQTDWSLRYLLISGESWDNCSTGTLRELPQYDSLRMVSWLTSLWDSSTDWQVWNYLSSTGSWL